MRHYVCVKKLNHWIGSHDQIGFFQSKSLRSRIVLLGETGRLQTVQTLQLSQWPSTVLKGRRSHIDELPNQQELNWTQSFEMSALT